MGRPQNLAILRSQTARRSLTMRLNLRRLLWASACSGDRRTLGAFDSLEPFEPFDFLDSFLLFFMRKSLCRVANCAQPLSILFQFNASRIRLVRKSKRTAVFAVPKPIRHVIKVFVRNTVQTVEYEIWGQTGEIACIDLKIEKTAGLARDIGIFHHVAD